MVPLIHLVQQALEGDQFFQDRQQTATRERVLPVLQPNLDLLDGQIREVFVHRRFVLEIPFRLALLHLKQGRLRDINVSALQQFRHLAEEERQEKRPDVAAVHVGVRHEDDLVIPRARDVERFLVRLVAVFLLSTNAGAERQNQRADFVAGQHFVEASFLDVENLALERENRLELAIAPLLGGAAGRISLDDEQLAQRGIFLGAIGQFPRQAASVQGTFPADELFGLAGCFAGTGRIYRLTDDLAGNGRILFKIGTEGLVDRRLDDALHLAVAQLRLRLPFELRIADLHTHHARQTFTHVVAAEGFRVLFQQIICIGVTVDRAG